MKFVIFNIPGLSLRKHQRAAPDCVTDSSLLYSHNQTALIFFIVWDFMKEVIAQKVNLILGRLYAEPLIAAQEIKSANFITNECNFPTNKIC